MLKKIVVSWFHVVYICSSEYLQDVTEVLMFLLLPPGDFHNTLFRYVVRVSRYMLRMRYDCATSFTCKFSFEMCFMNLYLLLHFRICFEFITRLSNSQLLFGLLPAEDGAALISVMLSDDVDVVELQSCEWSVCGWQEVVVSGILLPLMNIVSDPDFINQTITMFVSYQCAMCYYTF